MMVYCMRHGQTNYNLKRLCNDNPISDVHLTPAGRRQALEAAEGLGRVPLEKIIVSELPRTRETAEIVNRHHGVDIVTHPQINDIRSGFDGHPVRQYQRAIARDPLHARPDGGESLIDHKERVVSFIEWLRRQPYATVLVVAHEETLRVFYAHFLGLEDDQMLWLEFRNCEIISFEAH